MRNASRGVRKKSIPSVVDILRQKTTRDRRNVRGVGQEDGKYSHCATSLVEEKAVGNHASSEREERTGSKTV